MSGFFSTVLNVAGSFVGDPGLGNQIAGEAQPGFAAITQTPAQIAQTTLPAAQQALSNPGSINAANISPLSQQVAYATLPKTAAALAAAGYTFPAGSLGAEYQAPSIFNAFGGQNEDAVILGGVALLALLAWKAL